VLKSRAAGQKKKQGIIEYFSKSMPPSTKVIAQSIAYTYSLRSTTVQMGFSSLSDMWHTWAVSAIFSKTIQ